jgi:hypothetical protein
MKKTYPHFLMPLLCLFLLSSCKSQFNFVTRNLPEVDSSYIITKRGKRINAEKIILNSERFSVDNKKYALDTIAVIKSKKRYFVRQSGKLYQTAIYGKINLLYSIDFTSFSGTGTSSGHSNANKTYLQKQGSNQINEFNKEIFYEYVADNPEALKAAHAHYIWQNATWLTFAAGTASFIYFSGSLDGQNVFSSLAKPSLFVAGAIALHVVINKISDSKIRKAILIYDTAEQ